MLKEIHMVTDSNSAFVALIIKSTAFTGFAADWPYCSGQLNSRFNSGKVTAGQNQSVCVVLDKEFS